METNFAALLQRVGVDPRQVKVLRHKEQRHDLYAAWRDEKPAFELYQKVQKRSRRSLFRRPYLASCVGLKDGRTVFVGLYEIGTHTPVPTGLHERFGKDQPTPEHHDLYQVDPSPLLDQYAGRIVLDWDAPRAWVQNAENAHPITILDEIAVDQGGDKGRNPTWSRDELILALDLYMTNPSSAPGKTSRAVIELSELLNRLGNQVRGSVGTTFRNPAGVYMKMMNLRAYDPAVTAAGKVGLRAGGKGDEEVWREFAGDRDRLKAVADAIRQAVAKEAVEPIPFDEDDHMEEAPEGRVLTRLHRYKERNSKLVATKKGLVRSRTGKLVCEVCDFDFAQKYGARGDGFIEAHHIKPVHTLPTDGTTKIDDLVLLCSNCHRMIHAKGGWVTVEALKEMISQSGEDGAMRG